MSHQHLLRQFYHPADGVNMYLQNSLFTHHYMLPKTLGQKTYHKTLQKWSPKFTLHVPKCNISSCNYSAFTFCKSI